MALVKLVKHNKKVKVEVSVSKEIADSFTEELEYYNKHLSNNAALDFDPLIKKVTDELKKINGHNAAENKGIASNKVDSISASNE